MVNKYVLLVEDNPDDVALTEMAFKRAQISDQLMVIRDGREALDFLFQRGSYAGRNTDEQPELVLLDLKLPLVSGLEVLEAIRADNSFSKTPVVVLTSSMEDKDQTESCRLGANEYIRKPISFSSFVEVVQKIKANWLSGMRD